MNGSPSAIRRARAVFQCALELDVPLPRPTPAHELHQAMEQEEETGNAEEEDEEEEPPPSNCKRSDSV